MHGPRHTTSEALTYVARRIARYEQRGLGTAAAIRATASDYQIDEAKLVALIGRFGNESVLGWLPEPQELPA